MKYFQPMKLLSLSCLLLSACGPASLVFNDSAINGSQNSSAGSVGSGGGGSGNPVCYKESHLQPSNQICQSIDLLFVMDSSDSMKDNRAKVAQGLGSFVKELGSNADYQVAVMLAHGSVSAWSGKLFEHNGQSIFNSKLMSVDQISSDLESMVLNVPVDVKHEQGEFGSYSLLKGLTTNFASISQKGFFRPQAALAIVFVSDENDICAVYPAGSSMPGFTQPEHRLRARDCAYGIGSSAVIEQVKKIKGTQPVIFGAVAHLDPTYKEPNGVDGYGYGYLDIVQKTNGVSVEINNPTFYDGLASLGKLAATKFSLILDYTLEHGNVDASTIQTSVDGASVSHTFDDILNEVHLSSGGHALSLVEISYCEK